MQPPLKQPIGFWTARAAEAIGHRTRSALNDVGVPQPEWWVLHQLSLDEAGVSEEKIVATVGPNESDAVIHEAIDSLLDKGWIRSASGTLRWTVAGREKFRAAAEVQQQLEVERRRGISDDEFITAITVMQRTIDNVGGYAWHW
ncbi:Hypothetical protein BJL86_0497 [Dietzia timorensis]|uniref:HTH marR-type domain-containing protein n=3 Tax=Dietzia timorensis TaxID=499555 RepID=A0A173LKQ7_9ACTN|nr:Hypothetical protein BJL86_0497 [Dietzia timorensis]